ncbi:MAG: sulfite exporter TauE/SafE family protein, partial [Thermoplasmata archaeon]|nr:sulfite exporter TauE/SafE family protein [Thermoplasmata archaeon]
MNPLIFVLAGLFCGFVDSCLGMGFGVTSASVLITFGVAPAIASASVHMAEAVVDTVSAATHYKLGNVDFKISRHMLLPGIVASVLGAVFVSGLSLKMAKPFVQGTLLILGLVILYKHLKNYSPALSGSMNKRKAMLLGFIAAFV